MDLIKDLAGSIFELLFASVVPPILEGTQAVMRSIDERIARLERRIVRKLYALALVMFGAIMLLFALLSFLKDSLGVSDAAAYFSIGIGAFVSGLLFKLGDASR